MMQEIMMSVCTCLQAVVLHNGSCQYKVGEKVLSFRSSWSLSDLKWNFRMPSLLKKASSFIASRRKSVGNQLGDEPLSPEAKSLLVGIDIHKPILTGRVFKQSQDGKQFNKRFFVLYPKVLLYFQNERTYQNSLKAGKVSWWLKQVRFLHNVVSSSRWKMKLNDVLKYFSRFNLTEF